MRCSEEPDDGHSVDYTRAVDDQVRIQVEPDGSGLVAVGVKLSSDLPHGITLEAAIG